MYRFCYTIRYIIRNKVHEDPDSGMWEENEECHASSVGACLAGLKAIRKYVEVPSFSGKIYVSVPESVKAGDTFPISIELINYKNTTADIKIEAGLKRGKIQLTREEIGYIKAPYKKLVGISSNLTAPAYLFPARYKIVIIILCQPLILILDDPMFIGYQRRLVYPQPDRQYRR